MIPHARLHPSAPMSMVRTCSRPAPATLNEQVKVRTMIKANKISVILSIGSRIRLDGCTESANMVGERLLLLPSAAQRVVKLHQSQALVELRLGQAELGIKIAGIAIENLEVTCYATPIPHI